jgi:hypothetical protein
MVFSLVFVGSVRLCAAQEGLITVIGSDTTWTTADSPHTLTGPVFVVNGATLTIEAGVAVDLNGYYITVNGTLVALGTSSERVQITNGEKLEFTEFSNGWNEQTGYGCILRGANVSCTIVSSVSLKLDNCVLASIEVHDSVIVSNSEIGGRVTVGSSSEISDSFLWEHVYVGNSSIIRNNNINGSVIGGEDMTVSNNTIVGRVSVDHSTISNNTITYGIDGTSLIITENVVTLPEHTVLSYITGGAAISLSGGTSVISGNTLSGGGYRFDWGFRGSGTIGTIDIGSSSAVISDNVIYGDGIYLTGDCDSLVITNNTIESGIFCKLITWEGIRAIFDVNSFEISGNVITGTIDVNASSLSVSNNKLVGSAGTGLEFSVHGEEITSIYDNTISGFFIGISGSTTNGVLIEKNLITNNTRGIECTGSNIRVQNNTITNNTIGIYEGSSSTIIQYNNIENNTEHSIYLETTSENIDATNNWWGTTDTQTINLTIRDHKYDFDLGIVSFTPFLTEPNPEATLLVNPEIPEFPSWFVLPVLLVTTLAVIIARKRLTKSPVC